MSILGKIFGSRPRVSPTRIDTLEQFRQQVLGSELPVIVDVWSETCAPCKQLMPVLVNVATKYAGRIRVVELNTRAEPALLGQLGVRATPTLLIYDAGAEVGRMAGFRPEGWFDEMIATEFPDA